MAIRDIFKVNLKTFINPAAWIDYDWLRDQNRTIFSVLKNLFSIEKPLREESFEAAMKRQHINEADLESAITNYRRFALLFLLLGFITFVYTFYLFFRYWTILGWLLGMACTALFLSQAFKYDFWAFQMKQRKLGLTFKDWQRHVLGEKGPTS